MGNQATVLIRTDGFGALREAPQEFVQHLYNAINHVATGHGPTDVDAGWHGNPAQVVDVSHNDNTAVIAMAGGSGRRLCRIYNEWYWKSDHDLARAVCAQLMADYGITQQELLEERRKRRGINE